LARAIMSSRHAVDPSVSLAVWVPGTRGHYAPVPPAGNYRVLNASRQSSRDSPSIEKRHS
jgi:hypothetical protein